MHKFPKKLTKHSNRKLAGRLQILDDTLRHDPHVIFPGDLVIVRRAQYTNGFLPRRVE